jgi:hypothetical protein
MKQYLVVYMSEPGERGSLGDGVTDVQVEEIVRARTDELARTKIINEYGIEGVRVYKLSKRLRLK